MHAFTATINERVIKGVVKEKAAAKAAFDKAVAQNQQAALFSQETVEGKQLYEKLLVKTSHMFVQSSKWRSAMSTRERLSLLI